MGRRGKSYEAAICVDLAAADYLENENSATVRSVAQEYGVAPTSVQRCIKRARVEGTSPSQLRKSMALTKKQKMRNKKKPQDAVLLTSQETLQVKRAAIEVKEKRAEDVDAHRVERLRRKESQEEEKFMKAAAREAKKKLRCLAENEKATAKLTEELFTTTRAQPASCFLKAQGC
eukprot:gene9224-16369_t